MTNPDTNTLNGALEQLGITMADNLNTMGVSDADPSDGLTSLAMKILDIGPTPPTPTPASLDLSLTAGKQILSYADVSSGNEYATLTATVLDENDDPVEGATVELYKDNVLWDTLTTSSAGTVSKTYTSAGVGDVGFTAECGSLLTKTFSIQDLYKYDSTSHNISRPSSDSMVFDKVADTGSFRFSAILKPTSLGSSFNVGLSVKNPSSIVSLAFAGFTSSKGFGQYTNPSSIGAFTEINRTNGTLTVNTEYLFEMEINSNNQLIGKITRLSDNTVIYSYTGTVPSGLTGYDVGVFVRNQADLTYREIKFVYL